MQSKGQYWELVNRSETFEELANVILKMANNNGMIQGRDRKFNAEHMANNCINFKELGNPRLLTREFGIRQQALYINYCTQ
jgi:hypothetical protein